LDIGADLPIETQIEKLATRFCSTKEEAMQIHRELSVQIAELQVKAQSAMPPEIIKQGKNIIRVSREMLTRKMKECMDLITQSIVTLTTLQEDPTLECFETKARELQEAYDRTKGTMSMIAIMQCLAKIREA